MALLNWQGEKALRYDFVFLITFQIMIQMTNLPSKFLLNTAYFALYTLTKKKFF